MNRIAIITDSSCDLPKEYIAEHGIYVLPLHIIYSDGEYRDGVDITAQEVGDRLAAEIPSTSMPSPADVQAVFDDLRSKGISKLLFVLISSRLSGTLGMIKLMCELQENFEYEIVDSRILTVAQGFCVKEAVRLRERGLELGQYNAAIQDFRNEVFGWFSIPTLEYLQKGGRINTVGAAVGKLLHVCPVVFVSDEGVYVPAGIARGYKKAVDKMVELAMNKVKDYRFELGLVHCGAAALCNEIAARFKPLVGCEHISIDWVSPALSVHVGTGLVGLVICRKGICCR